MSHFLAAALLLLFAGSDASAAKWAGIHNGDDYALKLDLDSILEEGGIVKAWFWWVHESPQTAPNTAKYLSEKALWHFKCKGREVSHATSVYYSDQDGVNPIFRQSGLATGFDAVVPGTVGATMLAVVCPGVRRK